MAELVAYGTYAVKNAIVRIVEIFGRAGIGACALAINNDILPIEVALVRP